MTTEITNNLNLTDEGHTQYFSVPYSKFIKLYIFSFSFYSLYWFYKNWKLQQPYITEKINPPLRSIFCIFFVHSLVKRISNSLEAVGKGKHGKHLGLYATSFIVLIIVSNILGKIAEINKSYVYLDIVGYFLFALSAYPLAETQDKVNILKDDPLGEINNNYSWQHYVIVIVGGLIWTAGILGTLAMSFMSQK